MNAVTTSGQNRTVGAARGVSSLQPFQEELYLDLLAVADQAVRQAGGDFAQGVGRPVHAMFVPEELQDGLLWMLGSPVPHVFGQSRRGIARLDTQVDFQGMDGGFTRFAGFVQITFQFDRAEPGSDEVGVLATAPIPATRMVHTGWLQSVG